MPGAVPTPPRRNPGTARERPPDSPSGDALSPARRRGPAVRDRRSRTGEGSQTRVPGRPVGTPGPPGGLRSRTRSRGSKEGEQSEQAGQIPCFLVSPLMFPFLAPLPSFLVSSLLDFAALLPG